MVKRFLNLSFLFSMIVMPYSWAAKSKIELVEDRELSSSELRQKIRALQENVLDLESRVQKLEGNPEGKVTCFLETPFDGLFDATDVNETRARVEAVKACMSKVKSRIHCSTEKVKCGR
jgi:polyhydroxyalkanoate synthesis regulator phasin